jgi:type IV pilus assembly protein PilQ
MLERRALAFLAIVVISYLAGCAAHVDQKAALEKVPLDKVINAITTETKNDSFQVHVKGNSALTFTSVKQPMPTGVILYFPDTAFKEVNSEIKFNSSIVEAIKTSEITDDGHTARIEILLKKDVGYQVTKDDEGLLISFQSESGDSSVSSTNESNNSAPTIRTADATTAAAIKTANFTTTDPGRPITLAAGHDEDKSKAATPSILSIKPKSTATLGVAWMNRIDFASEDGGKSTVIVGTTSPVQYSLNKAGARKLELQLLQTNIPKYRQRPLITTRFESAIDRILPVQTPVMQNVSLVTFELREDVSYRAEQTGNIIMIHFDASSVPPRTLAEANLVDWKKVIAETTLQPAEATTASVPKKAPFVAPLAASSPAVAMVVDKPKTLHNAAITELDGFSSKENKTYTGEKVALDFYKTDLKNVFRILREVSGKNFAIDKDVSGSVTLVLDKPVPWDQVLDLVLKMNQLGMAYEQDIIRIATQTTLKNEEDLRSAQIAAAKKTQSQEKSLEPIFTEYIPVNYSKASSEVVPHIQNILTKERGTVSVDERNNQIIITDTIEVIQQAKKIVKRIDKVTPQVILEARVVEVTDSFSKELGITWNSTVGPQYVDLVDSDATGDMAMNFPAAGASSSVGFNFTRLTGVPFVLDARINALETQGDGKILSAPKIVTLDNKKAKIKQGLEYPYLERDDSGGSSVKFKNIDLLLEVTPHVTPDNRISMSIFITKNDVAGLTDGVPSISTNEAETELLVNDGDTIVIGGIIKSNESKGESAFPGLSRIPVLGWMFKNQTEKNQKNELLIFMTPRIVQLEQLQQS